MAAKIPAGKILVVMPNWLGDAVMATPFLAALRGIYPGGHLAALARPLAAPVLAGLEFVNETRVMGKGEKMSAVVKWIRAERFDLAVVLPNSFRSAWMIWRAGVKRRVGYGRDNRSFLLTHSIHPKRRSLQSFNEQTARFLFRNAVYGKDYQKGTGELVRYEAIPSSRLSYLEMMRDRESGGIYSHKAFYPRLGSFLPSLRGYEPTPTIDYYLKLAEYLGTLSNFPKQMHLAVTSEEQLEADSALAQAGISPAEHLITIVPGANFGSSKCYPPERFAQVADRLMDKQGAVNAHVMLATSPSEMGIAQRILDCSALCPGGKGMGRLHATATLNGGGALSIGGLKQVIRRSQLVLCNDTGPRHFAAALGVPLVTLFGPTDPVWAETYAKGEVILRAGVGCSPCQLKRCPIDHRCMTEIGVGTIFETISHILHPPAPPEPDVDPRSLEDLSTNF